MSRLSLKLKKNIIELIHNNFSINYISQKFSLAKSTIYYYYKKIKGKKYKLPKFTPGFTEKEGEIVGIFAGDGSQYLHKETYHYQVNIHFGEKNYEYLLYVKKLFDIYFNKDFYIHKEYGIPRRIRINSKVIYNFFKIYLKFNSKEKHSTVELKSVNYSNEFNIGFLRGLLDTDGCIHQDLKNKRIRITYCTTSNHLAKQIKILLDKLEIKASIYKIDRIKRNEKTIYNVSILSASIDKYLNTITPFKMKKTG